MKRKLCGRRIPLRLCWGPKILTPSRLFNLLTTLTVLITLLMFHNFWFDQQLRPNRVSRGRLLTLSTSSGPHQEIIQQKNFNSSNTPSFDKQLGANEEILKQKNFNSSNTPSFDKQLGANEEILKQKNFNSSNTPSFDKQLGANEEILKQKNFNSSNTPSFDKQLGANEEILKQKNFNSSNTPSLNGCRSWCHITKNSSKPFFLTAVLLMRIYAADRADLTTRELRQWLYYLQYAGFEHVYVYDAFVSDKNESQAHALKYLIDKGFVTYVDWSHKAFPYSIDGTQHSAYQDCINRFGHESVWQAAIDIDEYPFSPSDQKPKFVQRATELFSKQMPSASELTMENFLFLGKPLDSNEHPLLIDRLWRRTHGPANNLVKPIYKPSHVRSVRVHHNNLSKGRTINFPVNQLRLNHYWGARLQNWGEDTPEIIAKTEPDNSMESIVKILQNCISECLPSVDFVYHKQLT